MDVLLPWQGVELVARIKEYLRHKKVIRLATRIATLRYQLRHLSGPCNKKRREIAQKELDMRQDMLDQIKKDAT